MVNGIIGQKGGRKALILWVDPDDEPKQAKDNSQGGMAEKVKSMATSALNFLTLEFVGDYSKNSITPDVRKSEVHKYRSNITEVALEDGSIAAQHIIQKPIEITLQFEVTNSDKMLANALNMIGNLTKLDSLKQKPIFDKLTDIWKRKIPVTIITEQATYANMVIENMPIVHKQPYKGALQIMVDFKQLSFSTIAGFKGKTEEVDKSANPKQEGGTQTTTNLDVKEPAVVNGRVIEPGEYYEASSAAEADAIVAVGGISW